MTVFVEDLAALGTGATYATGGYTDKVAAPRQIDTVLDVQDISANGLVLRPVQGSETGQSFKWKAFVVASGTAGGALTELANASTAIASLKRRVRTSGS